VDVFNLRRQLIDDYRAYSDSFIKVRDPKIRARVEEELNSGALWPDPLIQLNPNFSSGQSVQALVDAGSLHPLCADIWVFNRSFFTTRLIGQRSLQITRLSLAQESRERGIG